LRTALQKKKKKKRKKSESQLRPETKIFLGKLQSYLDCRAQMDAKYLEIDEFQLIKGRSIHNDSGGICCPIPHTESERMRQKLYKAEYQQQSPQGTPVERLDDLYKAAELTSSLFQERTTALVQRLLHNCGNDDSNEEVNRRIKFAKLKGRDRALQKAHDDYSNRSPSPDVSWLYDISRCSIILDSAQEVLECIAILEQDPNFHIVKASNRFQKPTLTGYRDINFHIQLKNTKHGDFEHICEIQVHHRAIHSLDKELNTHLHYEYFRSYFAGATGSLKELLDDLKFVGEGAGTGESFLDDLLAKSEDVIRLQRLAKLFETQLCEYDWALKVYNRILSIQQVKSGSSTNTEVASTYRSMGSILREQNQLNGSMEMYLKALVIQRKLFGSEHLEVGITYKKMADVLYFQEELDDAMEMYEQSLSIHLQVFGSEHAEVALIYQSMGNVLRNQGKRQEPIEMFEKAIEIQLKTIGKEHSEVGWTYRNLGLVYYIHGNLNVAMDMFSKAVGIQLKALGPDHDSLSRTYRNIGLLYHSRGELEKALEIYNKALVIQLKILGPEHPLVVMTYKNIAHVLKDLGNEAAAMEMYKNANEIFAKTR